MCEMGLILHPPPKPDGDLQPVVAVPGPGVGELLGWRTVKSDWYRESYTQLCGKNRCPAVKHLD